MSVFVPHYTGSQIVNCRIAFDTDPLAYPPTWTDVSSDLVNISTKRGRQHQLDRIEAGTANVLLKNIDGNYWPDNAGGDYDPNVKIGKRLNLWAIYDGTIYDIYTGFVRKWNPVWFSQEGNLCPGMQLECVDLQRNLARGKLDVDYAEEASGIRIGNVLDDAGWNATERDLDAGKEDIQATGAVQINPMEHLFLVQESELSDFFIRGDGYARYIERGERSAAISATFGTGELPIHNPVFPLDDDLLYNEIRLTIEGGTEQSYSDADSILDFGLRTLSRSGLLLTADIAAYILCLYLLARYYEAKMRIKSFTIKPQTPGHETELWPLALGLDIGNRIALVWDEASIDGEYFIEDVEQSWDYREGLWETKFQCSDADQYYYTPDATEQTIRPDGAGATTELTPSAGANWNCVDEEVADDGGTYVYRSNSPKLDTYTLQTPSYSQGIINKVTVHCRGSVNALGSAPPDSTGYFCSVIRAGGTNYKGTHYRPTDTNWHNISTEYVLNPKTGLAWTWADIVALEAGVEAEASVSGGSYTGASLCTQVYVVINFTPEW